MKPGSRKLVPMLFAAILMLTLIQFPFPPSASAAPTGTNYNFPVTKMTFTDTDGSGLGWSSPGTSPVGRNIVSAWYNYDVGENSLYFQVNLAGATWTTNDRVDIFIDYKPGLPGVGGNFSGTGASTGAPAGLTGMDYFLELKHVGTGTPTNDGWKTPVVKYWKIAGNPVNSNWDVVPDSGNGNGAGVNAALFPKWYASGVNSTSLQWKIPLGGLYNPTATPFDFYVVTYPDSGAGWANYTDAQFDVTPAFHTPIPSAAWLLGSGIIGLIGLKRKRARMA